MVHAGVISYLPENPVFSEPYSCLTPKPLFRIIVIETTIFEQEIPNIGAIRLPVEFSGISVQDEEALSRGRILIT